MKKTNEYITLEQSTDMNLLTHLSTLKMDEKRITLSHEPIENQKVTSSMYLFLYEECLEAMRLRERTIHLAMDIYLRVCRRRLLKSFQLPDYLLASLLLAIKCDDLDTLIPRAEDLVKFFQMTSEDSGINCDMMSEMNQVGAEQDILYAHEFDIAVPLHYDFIHTYCHLGIVNADDEFKHESKSGAKSNEEWSKVK